MQPHNGSSQITVAEKADDIGPQWMLVHERHPRFWCLPGLVLLQNGQHFFPRDRFHPGKNIRGVLRIGTDHAQGTTADQHRGDTVTHGFRQGRRYQQLGIVMGMGIEKSRRYPATAGVNRARRKAGFGLLVKDFGNPPILDANMGDA